VTKFRALLLLEPIRRDSGSAIALSWRSLGISKITFMPES
jgi:hypothetical protein